MSTVEVEILGDGAFAGAVANVTNYSVREYGSPLSLTALSSGVASVDFSVLEDTGFDGSILLPGQPFELRDPYAGVQRGIIDNGDSDDGYTLSVRGNGVLYKLVSEREAPPLSGTLGQAVISYFALCGIDSGFQLDPEVAGIEVNLPSWRGDVWTQIKKLMAVYQFEIAEVAGTIVIRKLRLREVDITRYTSARLSYGRAPSSRIVEVHCYESRWAVREQVSPVAGETIGERRILSVGAGETLVTNYPVNMWITEIDSPQHILALPWDYVASGSVYSVVDKDGVAVTPQEWSAGGGALSFAIGEDGRSVDVTLVGMSASSRAPYRIASSSLDMEYQYSALYIAATGVAFEESVLWSPTGEDFRSAPADAVTVIDDPMVTTRAGALTVLAHAVRAESGFTQRLEVSATAINRRGETGQQIYPTFSEFDRQFAGATFGDFDAEFSGWTFGQFVDHQGEGSADDFSNQALGGIGGARVRHRDNIYRIVDGTSSPGGFGWTAEPDMLFSEWDRLSEDAPLTFGDFDAKWTGKTFEQHARMPLSSGRG